ncbi:MAG: hypothetical protein ACFCUQ_21225 [Kiloniellales bacterium]
MAISFAEATGRLLSGSELSWQKFGGHKGSSVTLGEPGQRRLLKYLLKQSSSKVAEANEELFQGLIAAWEAQAIIFEISKSVALGQKSLVEALRKDAKSASDQAGANLANTSWLRAILWAFVLSLREQTLEGLVGNTFPLIVLDDPQVTFDPRNKRKWAEELTALANKAPGEKEAAQLFLTTHERQFFQILVNYEQLAGQQGLIAAVNKTTGVATVVNGSSLSR